MESAIVSTAGLPPLEQIEAWRAWFDGIFDVEVPDGAQGFAASSTQWTLGGVSFARVAAPSLRAERSSRLVRRNPVDHWVIGMGSSVNTRFVCRNDAGVIPPQVPFVSSLGDAFISEREADVRLHLYLPRDRFCALAPVLDATRGAAVEGSRGGFLRDYMTLLERHLPTMTGSDPSRLTEAVGAMIAACIAPSPDRLQEAASQLDLVRLERARQIIRCHLRSARLGPDMLCRELGMSRSHLYRLFQPQGGVAHYIQHCRLTAVYAALSDPLECRSLGVIAEDYGFYSASGFSRAFRKAFGAAPSEVRVAGAQLQRPRQLAPGPMLIDCLRA